VSRFYKHFFLFPQKKEEREREKNFDHIQKKKRYL